MAKYSTGGSSNTSSNGEGSSDGGGFCELCGKEASYLHNVTVSGANLNVCGDCSDRDDSKQSTSSNSNSNSNSSGSNSTKDLIQKTTRDTADPDSSWAEKGMNYDDTALPYLRDSYDTIVADARADEDLSVEELADEISVEASEIKSVENNSAMSDNVSGVVIERLEEYFDVRLTEAV